MLLIKFCKALFELIGVAHNSLVTKKIQRINYVVDLLAHLRWERWLIAPDIIKLTRALVNYGVVEKFENK